MKNILITGASSGIGLEIANLLSKNNDIFMTARRKANKVNYFSCDLIRYINIIFLYNFKLIK